MFGAKTVLAGLRLKDSVGECKIHIWSLFKKFLVAQLYGLPHEILHVFNTILYLNEFQNPQIFQQTISLFPKQSTLDFAHKKVLLTTVSSYDACILYQDFVANCCNKYNFDFFDQMTTHEQYGNWEARSV
jgi:hypothetical protein